MTPEATTLTGQQREPPERDRGQILHPASLAREALMASEFEYICPQVGVVLKT